MDVLKIRFVGTGRRAWLVHYSILHCILYCHIQQAYICASDFKALTQSRRSGVADSSLPGNKEK